MSYHMIYTREAGAWAPQFGDKSKECVQQEREDSYLKQRGTSYAGDGKYTAKDIKLVKFSRVPSQAQVNARTTELNS